MKFSITSLFNKQNNEPAADRYEDLNRRKAMSIRNQPQAGILEESRLIAPVLSDIFIAVREKLVAGVSKQSIHDFVLAEITNQGYAPAMLGFNGFPAAAAISGDHELIHGVPDEGLIKGGSLVTVESSLASNHAYASQGWTFAVGNINEQQKRLLGAAEQALISAISEVRCGAHVGDLASVIQATVEDEGFQVIREYCGYTMGSERIMEPPLLCYGKRGTGERLVEGQILHIHVLAKAGNRKIIQSADNWTVYAKDRNSCVTLTAMVAVEAQRGVLLSKLID